MSLVSVTLLGLATGAAALPSTGVSVEIDSFSVPASPSGAFFDVDSDVLYVLAGTRTNGDHALYATSSVGDLLCTITIPEAAGMSRVDGFQVVGDTAYIVDSQGPIYAGTEGRLGGSIYVVEWTDPCGCADGEGTDCTEVAVTWSPTVTSQLFIDATDESIEDGGGVDDSFRNSGIAIVGDTVYAVNGVHPSPDLTCCYPKSLVALALNDTAADGATALARWSFDATTIGHDVDMEALSCGGDDCATYLYIGDEYNYVYRLNLGTADPLAAIEVEWDLNAILGAIPDDKGIESMAYNQHTGYFYVGIQETAMVHVVSLLEPGSTVPSTTAAPSSTPSSDGTFESTSIAGCPVTDTFLECAAPVFTGERRVRREVRSLSSTEWDALVVAMWTMKNLTQREGMEQYGPAFRSFDYLAARHAVAQTDLRGDQAHFGSWFATWHSAFVLEFELSVLAVDPSIGAIPYWDQTLTTPHIFVDDYFGVDPTNETQFQMATGRFAYWPILSDEAIFQELIGDYVVNASLVGYPTLAPTGFLRGYTNTQTTPYETRLGSGAAVETTPGPYDPAGFVKCAEDNADWPSWESCISGGYHNGPHGTIGGKNGDFEDPVTSPNSPIFFFHHANMDRSRVWFQMAHGDKRCSYYEYPASGAVPTPSTAGMGGAGGMGDMGGMGGMGGMGPPMRKRQDSQSDGSDANSGVNLNDVMSQAWGFTFADIGLGDDPLDRSVQLTHGETICWLTPAVSSYTYDNLVDQFAGSLDAPVVDEPADEPTDEPADVDDESCAARAAPALTVAAVIAASLVAW